MCDLRGLPPPRPPRRVSSSILLRLPNGSLFLLSKEKVLSLLNMLNCLLMTELSLALSSLSPSQANFKKGRINSSPLLLYVAFPQLTAPDSPCSTSLKFLPCRFLQKQQCKAKLFPWGWGGGWRNEEVTQKGKQMIVSSNQFSLWAPGA